MRGSKLIGEAQRTGVRRYVWPYRARPDEWDAEWAAIENGESIVVQPSSSSDPVVQSQGPLFPGAASNKPIASGVDWSNASNISASDSVAASAFLLAGEHTNYLAASQFGFTIPAGATILGVVVTILRRRDTGVGTGTIADFELSLQLEAGISGDNKADDTSWPNGYEAVSYGANDDLWGLTLDADDVNHQDFGVVLSAENTHFANDGAPNVDSITMTVYYIA